MSAAFSSRVEPINMFFEMPSTYACEGSQEFSRSQTKGIPETKPVELVAAHSFGGPPN
jgi:hypothetical protein